MSRIVLAALRKHKSPAEFTRKFLLPVFKRGLIPQLPALPEGKGQKPANPRATGPIIFVNVRNPSEEFYFSLERAGIGTYKGRPNAVLFNRQERGAKVQERDWEEGKQFAHTRRRGIYEELEIDKEHLAEEWEKVVMPREAGRARYPIPEKLFRELQRYGVAGQAANAISNLLVLASGRISSQQARKLSPFRIESGTNFYVQFGRSIPFSAAGLRTILSSTTVHDTARVIQREMEVSAKYATRLAEHIEDRKKRAIKHEDLAKLIAMFRQY